jgi:hypothetical protein
MIVALASPCIASTLDEGLDKVERSLGLPARRYAPERYQESDWRER